MEELKKRLSSVETDMSGVRTDIALMKQAQATAVVASSRLEDIMFRAIGELRAAIMEKLEDLASDVKKMEHSLFVGNGTPSFDTRLKDLELTEATRTGQLASSAQFWKRLSPFIPWITAILGAAGMWAVKSVKP